MEDTNEFEMERIQVRLTVKGVLELKGSQGSPGQTLFRWRNRNSEGASSSQRHTAR